MKTHQLLVATERMAPEMVNNDLLVLVDSGTGPQYFLKAEVLEVLRKHVPFLAEQLESVGSINSHLMEWEFKAVCKALATLQPSPTGLSQ